MGFGMTTILLNIHNAGFFPISAMILAMGLCYGGLAQIIAGIMEYKRGNTFGVTAFISYGTFWWSLVFLLVMPTMGLAEATPRLHGLVPADVGHVHPVHADRDRQLPA
jgi:succinate-acetate transporter protein